MPRRLKVVPTVQSVLETDVYELAAHPGDFGLDGYETYAYQLLAESVNRTGDHLRVPATVRDREVVADLLTDLSNTYDDFVEEGRSSDAAFDRRAARSLATLAGKVRQ